MRARKNPEYSGSHTASDRESGAPLHDVTGIYPDDIYSSNAFRYYGHYGDSRDYEAIGIIQRFKGKPDRLIRVYRAVPKDVRKINPGDWVTTVRAYAKEHGESTLLGDYRILSKVVHARDIFTSGDCPFEWGYDPQPFVKKSMRAKQNPAIPNGLDRIIEPGDIVLDYDSAQGEDFYDLYDLVYTKRRPTTGEIEEVAGMLSDTGVFAVLSGEDRDLGKYFQKVRRIGNVVLAQGPSNPEVSRINAEKRRRK